MRVAQSPRRARLAALAFGLLVSAGCRPEVQPPVGEVVLGDLVFRYFHAGGDAPPGEYSFSATVENQGAVALEGFEVEVTSTDPGTVVLDAYAGFPPVAPGETVDATSFFRVSQPSGTEFDPAPLAFAVSLEGLPATLVDGAGFSWEIRDRGEARVLEADAFDYVGRLRMNGTWSGRETEAHTELGGRQLVHGPRETVRYEVTRKIWVHPERGLVRWLDTVVNTDPVQRATGIRIEAAGHPASPPSAVVATSSGDLAATPEDGWLVLDDGPDGRPPRLVAWAGGTPDLAPSDVLVDVPPGPFYFEGTSVHVSFDRMMPAGGRIAFLHFAARAGSEAEALATAATLDPLDPTLLYGLRIDELRAIVNWGVLPDADGDGLSDEHEAELGTDPGDADTDGDGVPDGYEVDRGLDATVADGSSDADGDGLDLLGEYTTGTDPTAPDTDGDGVLDGDEVLVHGTDPFVRDTDGDGLLDGEEIAAGTDPLDAAGDADGDGLLDVDEIQTHGTDPLDADTDDDGIDDATEVATHGLDPLDGGDAGIDVDGDGLTAAQEVALGTHIFQLDSDQDALGDGDEVALGTVPTVYDTDGGGRSDGQEHWLDATDPLAAGDDLLEVPLPVSRIDGDGFDWDFDDRGVVHEGTNGAFDAAFQASAGPCSFQADGSVAAPLDLSRTIRIGPRRCSGLLLHSREIYVPLDAGFARYREVLDNAGPEPRTVTVQVRSDLPDPTRALGSSTGDVFFGPEDDWLATEPTDAGVGGPVAFVVGGPRAAVEPTRAWRDRSSYATGHAEDPDGRVVIAEWTVTLAPGERVSLLHFAVQGSDAADATDTAAWLRGLPEPALRNLSAAERATVANFDARPDADGDGLPDADEGPAGTDPGNPDTDGDGLRDGFEVAHGTDPLVGGDAGVDADGDGLDAAEEQDAETDPNAADTDGDGLDDGAELGVHGTSPLVADHDRDDLDDAFEVAAGLDPLDAFGDPDGDGLIDSDEILDHGTDPFDADSDDDGMSDGFEVAEFFDPLDPADAAEDRDDDGLDNLTESVLGTDPRDADTDDDRFLDGEEIALGTDPLLADGDGGGRSDYEELVYDGTDPNVAADDLPVVATPVFLLDGGGFEWSFDAEGRIQATSVFQDAGDAYPYYSGAGSVALEEGGRELVYPPDSWLGLELRRKVYVPEDAAFVRYLDIVENVGDQPDTQRITFSIDYNVQMLLSATSGNFVVDEDTLWLVQLSIMAAHADVAVVVQGPGAPVPAFDVYDGSTGNLDIRHELDLAPGERAIVMTFLVQAPDVATAQAAATSLVDLQGAALDGMSPDELADVVNFDVTP